MRFKSSEDITSRVDRIVSNTFTHMLRSSHTMTEFETDENGCENAIRVLSLLTVRVDEYNTCTVYVFHNLKEGVLQVFVSCRYPQEDFKNEEKIHKDKQLTDIVRATYKYCLRYDEAKWQEYWDVLNIDCESMHISDQFAFKLIDIRDSKVEGDVNLKDVVNCNKLANVVCNIMRDMGGQLKDQ